MIFLQNLFSTEAKKTTYSTSTKNSYIKIIDQTANNVLKNPHNYKLASEKLDAIEKYFKEKKLLSKKTVKDNDISDILSHIKNKQNILSNYKSELSSEIQNLNPVKIKPQTKDIDKNFHNQSFNLIDFISSNKFKISLGLGITILGIAGYSLFYKLRKKSNRYNIIY